MRDRDLRGFDGGDARTTTGAGFPKGPPPCGPFGRAEGVARSWQDRSQDDDDIGDDVKVLGGLKAKTSVRTSKCWVD